MYELSAVCDTSATHILDCMLDINVVDVVMDGFAELGSALTSLVVAALYGLDGVPQFRVVRAGRDLDFGRARRILSDRFWP